MKPRSGKWNPWQFSPVPCRILFPQTPSTSSGQGSEDSSSRVQHTEYDLAKTRSILQDNSALAVIMAEFTGDHPQLPGSVLYLYANRMPCAPQRRHCPTVISSLSFCPLFAYFMPTYNNSLPTYFEALFSLHAEHPLAHLDCL